MSEAKTFNTNGEAHEDQVESDKFVFDLIHDTFFQNIYSGESSSIKRLYDHIGLDGIVGGFKAARAQAGEQTFQGLEPTRTAENIRTPRDEYLTLLSERKLAFSDWDTHDTSLHMAGALLTSRGVADILQQGAAQARAGSESVRSKVLRAADISTYYIQQMWLTSGFTEQLTSGLANHLHAMNLAVDSPYTYRQTNVVAHNQAAFIKDLSGSLRENNTLI